MNYNSDYRCNGNSAALRSENMAQPNYDDSEQERLQKQLYELLADDTSLHLTDGVMNYIARLVSEYVQEHRR